MLFFFLPNVVLFSQNCGTPDFLQRNASSFDNLEFSRDESCTNLFIKCNIIVITRDDGTGGLDPSYVNSMKSSSSGKWGEMVDENLICNPSLDNSPRRDLNIRLDYKVHYEPNTAAWDWYDAAKRHGIPIANQGSNRHLLCPNNLEASRDWPELMDLVDSYYAQYPNEFNIFIVENGARLAYYENAIANGVDIPDKWENVNPIPSINGENLFDGCSRQPVDYHGNRHQWVIITDLNTDYISTLYFNHIENAPANPANNAANADARRWSDARLINHELAHSFDLGHTCACRYLNNSGPGCSFDAHGDYLPHDEFELIQRTIANSNIHKFVKCGSLTENNCNIETIGNETVDEPMSVFGDLIVKSGHTLTLTDEVFLSEESTIDVEPGGKLILDGALLTTGCEFETWKGIRVTGGNSDFDVETKKGAIIENTSEAAISMFPPNIGWPEVQNFGNGIVLASNTTFRNCERMAELIAFSPSSNISQFNNCVQYGGTYGITNWHSEGVKVDNCRFYGIAEHCVGAYDGTYEITNNEFYGGTEEILFTNTKAGKESNIENNTFNTAPTGLRAIGTHTGKLNIFDNTFFSSDQGIVMEKMNNYDVVRNSFVNPQYGVYCEQNGVKLSNNIDDNIFTNNERGIISVVDNDLLSFKRNCFTTSKIDVEIYGLVSRRMGGSAPAGNCFSHKGSVNSGVVDMGGNPQVRPELFDPNDPDAEISFFYIEPDDQIENCIDAVKAHGNIKRLKLDPTTIIDFCHDDDPEDPEEPTPCDPERSVVGLSQAIADLESEIESVLGSDFDETQKQALVYTPDRCRSRLNGQLYGLFLELEEYAAAKSLFMPEQSFDDRIVVLSVDLTAGDLVSAKEYLNNMLTTNLEEQDFIFTQKLNIKRLEQGPGYVVPEAKLNSLLSISERDHSYAGFAKSLYYQLTGNLAPIEINLPDYPEEIGERSQDFAEQKNSSIGIYPNPFNRLLTLDIDLREDLTVTISNISGLLIYKAENQSGIIEVNTTSWNQGVYFIQIENGEEVLSREKIVLVK